MRKRNKKYEKPVVPKQVADEKPKQLTPPPEKFITDSFSNALARIGLGVGGFLDGTQYKNDHKLTSNFTELNALYRGNWIVQNIINTIPQDIIKRWYKVVCEVSQAEKDAYAEYERAINLRESVLKGMKWGRLYGGAAGIILIEGDEDMSLPLYPENVTLGGFKGLYIVDRWNGISPTGNIDVHPGTPSYGLPEFYDVVNASGQTIRRVHHTRVIRFIGRDLPYTEKIAECYWGQSELEAIYEEVIKRDNVSHNIASLTFKANLSVREMDNLDQLFAVGGAQAQKRFWSVLQAQSMLETNLGVKAINKGDKVSQLSYTFSGLPDVYEMCMMDVAGASNIPVTKLFGRSPAGMNATGESDAQNYNDYLDSVRESQLRPALETLVPLVCKSVWGYIPSGITISFDSFKTPTDLERADVIAKKVEILTKIYTVGGMDKKTYLQEIKDLMAYSGMFTHLSDELIEAGANVFYNATGDTGSSDPFSDLFNPDPGQGQAKLEDPETVHEQMQSGGNDVGV